MKSANKGVNLPYGIPRLQEYLTIELTKEFTVEDARANRVSLKFVEYLNDIKSARLQVWETLLAKKKVGKNKGPTAGQISRVKNYLTLLMNNMDDEKASVLLAGGIPLPVPKHFYKAIDV